MDAAKYKRRTRRWLPLTLVVTLLAGGLAYFYASGLTPTYQASTTLNVGQASARVPDYNSLLVAAELSKYYAFQATKQPVLEPAALRLEPPTTASDLVDRVGAVAVPDSSLITITARDADPDRAAAIANAVAEQLLEQELSSPAENPGDEGLQQDIVALRREIDSTTASIASLEERGRLNAAQQDRLFTLRSSLANLVANHAALLSLSLARDESDLQVVVPAIAPGAPVEPRPVLLAALAALAGLLAALGLAFLAEYFDDTLRVSSDVEQAAGLPTLGVVREPKGGRDGSDPGLLTTLSQADSLEAEAYQGLRANVELAARGGRLRTILVTGVAPSHGKSAVAGNLAIAFALSGRRVLLVDANMRSPRLDRLFKLSNQRGLTSFMAMDHPVVAYHSQPSPLPSLRVMTTGVAPSIPGEMFVSERMTAVLQGLMDEADLVIVDGPALHPVSDGAVLSSLVDATLLVVTLGRSSRDSLARARESLALAGARPVGTVVLDRKVKRSFRAAPAPYRGSSAYRAWGTPPKPAAAPANAPAAPQAKPAAAQANAPAAPQAGTPPKPAAAQATPQAKPSAAPANTQAAPQAKPAAAQANAPAAPQAKPAAAQANAPAAPQAKPAAAQANAPAAPQAKPAAAQANAPAAPQAKPAAAQANAPAAPQAKPAAAQANAPAAPQAGTPPKPAAAQANTPGAPQGGTPAKPAAARWT